MSRFSLFLQQFRRHRNAILVALCGLVMSLGATTLSEGIGQAYLLSRAPFSVQPEKQFAVPDTPKKSAPITPHPTPASYTVYPFSSTPNWGAMRSPAEWERTYGEIPISEWVPLPTYDRAVLTTPLESLLKPLTPANIEKITTKLTYSTRFFGKYNLDSDEFMGSHAGIDIKMPAGTPIATIAGGTVEQVGREPVLGIRVIIKHEIDHAIYYSIYGHLQETVVEAGDTVEPGVIIGTVGMTGSTSAPHLHLQIDKDTGDVPHVPYRPRRTVSRAEAQQFTVHPLTFIEEHLAH